ncbi:MULTISPECIES: hypothetical protein [Spiroplasma]|uniref:Uncharacterized protein n=1 Tax=Spiroplasma ixodetis TaxID=2141 RepID=A0ABN6T1D2_9MOLU|nr:MULTISPECIES: hypothetical protein [Spiroplasma]BDT05218.1 hypothetical protein SHM_28640 [Spiroplasma ixodetis]
MPILDKKDIDIEKKLNKTVSFSNEIKKDTRIKLTPMTCKPELILKFNDLAKIRKWKKTTLMNEILEDFFNRLEKYKNEND